MLANVIAERAGWLSDLITRWGDHPGDGRWRNQSASFGDPGRGIGCYLQIWALLRAARTTFLLEFNMSAPCAQNPNYGPGRRALTFL